jgi:acyl dehydratase
MRAFEDFSVGDTFVLPDVPVTRDDIVGFAADFDPQPFHLVDDPPLTDFGGGLIASGWQVCALFMRALVDGLLRDSTCIGSPGVETLKWQRAVRPGETLVCRTTVISTARWPADRRLGLVRFRHEAWNAPEARALMMENAILFERRGQA